ncbi:MAG: S28 family serine protease [Bacteroidales bacterium]
MIISVLFLVISSFYASEFESKLRSLPGVVSVEKLNSVDFFSEKYLVIFEQPLDHSLPEAGTFKQRVFVSHKTYNSPVVFVTEGYSAEYASKPNYINELSDLLMANQICVEHRFFGKSVPDNIDWSYLTTSQAAEDHHKIREAFKQIYKTKWVATGISKGGQTALLYQMYFPRDVDITVAYVAPVARALEDGRHEIFLKNVATKKERQKVLEYQIEMLKRRDKIFPMFEAFLKNQKLSYYIPLEEVYEFCILEYEFAFWQWVGDVTKIPPKKSQDYVLFQHLLAVSHPDYFSIESSKETFPFYYQAARELGYYGYDTESLKKFLVHVQSAKGYFNKVFLPKNMNVDFYPQTAIDLENFIKQKAKNTILIYGEFDPWTAAAPDVGNNQNVVKIIGPRGTHATRIKTLQKSQIDQVMGLLSKWLQ